MQVFLGKSGIFPRKDLHNQKKSCNFAADLDKLFDYIIISYENIS